MIRHTLRNQNRSKPNELFNYTIKVIMKFIINLITAAVAADTTKLLVEVCRHGARASSSIYPLTVDDPYDNFQEASALTLTGAL